MAPIRVQDVLETASLADSGAKIIVYPPGEPAAPVEMLYKDLFTEAKRNSESLCRHPAWKQGSVIIIHLRDQVSAIIWFWSVLYAGCIPAMSAALPNSTTQRTEHLSHLFETLEGPLCLTSKDELNQFSGQDIIQPIVIESIKQGLETQVRSSDIPQSSCLQDTALLMLTSGSTSKAKAVCLSHQQLLAAVRGKALVKELPKKTAFLNWIAMDHVASLVEIHLQALYLDMDQVHVAGANVLTEPEYFLDLIDRHRVSRTFAPNFFLAKLKNQLEQQNSKRAWDLSCLRYIASGGEANVTSVCVAVVEVLKTYNAPQNTIVPGFGMTETCAGSIFNLSCPTYDIQNGLEFLSLGHCMPGIEMRITEDGQLGEPGVVGNLEVRGEVVFKRYFNNAVATKAAFTNDGWFITGDRGMMDASGHLRLTARAKDIIIVNSVKYSPQDIENAIEEARISGVTPSFTVSFSSWSSRLATEEIYILFLPSYQIGDEVARLATSKRITKEVVLVTGARPVVIPVDETILHKSSLGKLSRGKLKAMLERGELKKFEVVNSQGIHAASNHLQRHPINHDEECIFEVFRNTLRNLPEDFDVETPFFDAGITSIELIHLKRNIKLALALEDEMPITTLINHPTVRTLARELRKLNEVVEYEPVVTLQPEGDKTPLWLIHPGVGEVLVFVTLAKYITQRKLYALRARGFNIGETYFQSIDEAVHAYYKSIKRTQPLGPYAIAGYSYGTMLAFEVAKELEKHGDKVAFCGSFNLPPHIKTRMRQLDWNECLVHLSYFLRLFNEQHGRQLADESRHHKYERNIILDNVFRDADQKRVADLSLTPTGLANWASLAYSLQSMASNYEPSGSVDSIDVFYCTPLAIVSASRQEWMENHMSKWSNFARSSPRFHEVQGEHYTMLDQDNIFTFQQTLNKALKARGL